MKALSIHPSSKEIKEIEIEMKANSVYSFFNSILIDEIETLKDHLIFTDANALSQHKDVCFLGEQLLVGNALLIGKNAMEEVDATIPATELKKLVSHDVPQFYKDALSLLSRTDINLYRAFTVLQGGEKLPLNCEWVLYTFNIADERTKEYFLTELQKALDDEKSVEEYVQKMAQLAINAGS